FCYQNARALVFPSLDEGFGLPVIEALQNGLPVIASDIPVLREIGKDMLMYIDPYDSLTLASRISQIADTGIEAQYMPKDFHWLSWQESSEQFLDKVLGGTSWKLPLFMTGWSVLVAQSAYWLNCLGNFRRLISLPW